MALGLSPNGEGAVPKRGLAYHPQRATWSFIRTRCRAVHRRDGSARVGHVDRCVRTLDVWRECSNLKILDYIFLYAIFTQIPYTTSHTFRYSEIGCSLLGGNVRRVPLRYGPSDRARSRGTLGPGKWLQKTKDMVGRFRHQWARWVNSRPRQIWNVPYISIFEEIRKHLRHEYGQVWNGLINGIILL
jgi:hypothetical protein